MTFCFIVKQAINNNIDTYALVNNTISESECIIKTTKNFHTLSTETINIEELTKQNDMLDKNLNTELQNKSTSVILSDLYLPVIQMSENAGKNFNFYYLHYD